MLARRFLRGCTGPQRVGPLMLGSLRPPASRVFRTTAFQCKDDTRTRTVQHETVQGKTEAPESVKPETVQKEKGPAAAPSKQDGLLSENTVTNKEQRKADWAIIRDMAHYLWPKNDFGTRFRVGLSVGLLVGAKVVPTSPSSWSSRVCGVDRSSIGPQCTSSFLLQDHRRLDECRFRGCGRNSYDCCRSHYLCL